METPVIYMIILILKSVFHFYYCKPPAQILFISHLLSQLKKKCLEKAPLAQQAVFLYFQPSVQN